MNVINAIIELMMMDDTTNGKDVGVVEYCYYKETQDFFL